MSKSVLLVGTRKGLFVLESGDRRDWSDRSNWRNRRRRRDRCHRRDRRHRTDRSYRAGGRRWRTWRSGYTGSAGRNGRNRSDWRDGRAGTGGRWNEPGLRRIGESERDAAGKRLHGDTHGWNGFVSIELSGRRVHGSHGKIPAGHRHADREHLRGLDVRRRSHRG